MLNRRGFLRHAAAAGAGVVCVGCGSDMRSVNQRRRHAARSPWAAVGSTVDVHAHCAVPAVIDVVKGSQIERRPAAT